MAIFTPAVCGCDCGNNVVQLIDPDDEEVDDWVQCQCFECGPVQDGQRQCSIKVHPMLFLFRVWAGMADNTEAVGDYCEDCEEHRSRCKHEAKRRRVEVPRVKSIRKGKNPASEGKQSPQLDMKASPGITDGKAPKSQQSHAEDDC